MAEAVPENSTTGRIHNIADPLPRKIDGVPRLLRAGFRALEAVAPSAAVAIANRLYFQPLAKIGPRKPEAPPLRTHRFTLRDGGSALAIYDWADGPTVLLAHGWNGAAAQMTGFVVPLVRAGYFVAALDMPAHGESEGTRTNVSEFADAIARLGRRLGPVHAVIGHSLGGTAAALAVVRGLAVRRLALLAPPAGMSQFARRFAEALGLGERAAAELDARAHQSVGGAQAIDVLARAKPTPMLVMHDPADREVPFADGQRIAAAWPGARFEPAPGRGHTRILRDGEVIRRVVDFISSDDSALARAG